MNKFRSCLRPVIRNMDTLIKRRAFNTWKDNANKLNTNDKLKDAQLKIMKLFYGKFSVGHLKKYFVIWRKQCDTYQKK